MSHSQIHRTAAPGRRRGLACAAAAALLLAGCATRGMPAPLGAPVEDPAALAAEFRRATQPEGPRQGNFGWMLDEAGSRLRGQGVVRFQAPDRLRLDLFGPRGETYLAAALVDEEFRMPAAAAQGVALPSPALLWGALGVVRPPEGATLVSATATEDQAALRYELADRQVLEYRARRGPEGLVLTRVERIGPSGVIESIQLETDAEAQLTRTRYRDWSAYRDLTLDFQGITHVSPFADAVWRPDARPR